MDRRRQQRSQSHGKCGVEVERAFFPGEMARFFWLATALAMPLLSSGASPSEIISTWPIAVCMPRTFKRAVLLMSGHAQPFGGSATTTPAEGVLPVEISRYGGSSLKMTTGELAPGEYAVGHPYGPAVFCFGVD
jgi:hypothetical protein